MCDEHPTKTHTEHLLFIDNLKLIGVELQKLLQRVRTFSEARKRYVVKHNLITEVCSMTVMEITTCFGLYWPSSGCLGNLRASYMHARACGVEIYTHTVIKYTSVIKLCLTTYLFLVSHTQRG